MKFKISTQGFTDIIDITDKVASAVKKAKIKEGICVISCPGSTAALTTIEYESGLIEDLKRALERIASMSKDYEHCKKWGDCNGFSHIRSALLKPFLVVPVEDEKLILGTWQNIVLIDFDNRPRKRKIIIKVIKA